MKDSVILHDKIKHLRWQADRLEMIGNYCHDVKFYLEAIGLLESFEVQNTGNAVFVLNTKIRPISDEMLAKALYNCLKKQTHKDKFAINWVKVKDCDSDEMIIALVYCEFADSDNHKVNNGHLGKNI